MNAQEIFDKVATHLLYQGHRAMVSNTCVYRAPNGDMCAVGVLISDEYYHKGLEGVPVGGICSQLPEWFACHRRLLIDLQRIHDGVWNWETKEKLVFVLRGLAIRWKLDDSILDSIPLEKVPLEKVELL